MKWGGYRSPTAKKKAIIVVAQTPTGTARGQAARD